MTSGSRERSAAQARLVRTAARVRPASTSQPQRASSSWAVAHLDMELTAPTAGWIRLRWGVAGVVMGFNPPTFALVPITGTVQRITIVFDEAQDSFGGPD